MSEIIFRNIKKLASEKNLTLRKIETLCDPPLGNGTIAGWENGNPTISNVEKVARVLKCQVSDLLKDKK